MPNASPARLTPQLQSPQELQGYCHEDADVAFILRQVQAEVAFMLSQMEALLIGQQNLEHGQARFEKALVKKDMPQMEAHASYGMVFSGVSGPELQPSNRPSPHPWNVTTMPAARCHGLPVEMHMGGSPSLPIDDAPDMDDVEPVTKQPSIVIAPPEDPPDMLAPPEDPPDMPTRAFTASRESSEGSIGARTSMTSAPRLFKIHRTQDLPQHSKQIYKRRKDRLQHLLSLNEEVEKEEQMAVEASLKKRVNPQSLRERLTFTAMDATVLESRIDFCMGISILANTFVIGLSVDNEAGQWRLWNVFDAIFVAGFLIEFCIKLYLHGMQGYFCGVRRVGNTFDSLIVLLDVTQTILGLIIQSDTTHLATFFRILRLFRILRVIRVFRSKAITGLIDMFNGIISGIKTLGWAVVLFLMIMYVFAVVCRFSLGLERESHWGDMYPYFDSVPRSMFTIFRCSFGDCNTEDGVSIPEHISRHYGGVYTLAYCSFVFFITIGLFNIISAIFVESTMAAAKKQDDKRVRARLSDGKRWSTHVATIIRELLGSVPKHKHLMADMLANVDTIVHIEFPQDLIYEVVNGNQDVIDALYQLDIDANDHKRLSDILDPDHSGYIGVLELIEGLRRLRGEPRRSDVVSIDLMVRVLQERVDHTLELVMDLHDL